MINRQLEQNLIKTLRLFPALAILGPRQAGKTTLAKSLVKGLKKKSIYLDMENPDDRFLLQNPVPYFNQHKNDCIIIDEVQRIPELFPVLRSVIDSHRKPGRFLLLGSASPDLLAKSSETLAGRIYYHELSPFLLNEVADKFNTERLLLRGGFPIPFLARKSEDARLWQQSFLTTYVERELPALGLSVSPQLVQRLFQMLAHLHGSIINYSQLAAALGVSSPTVHKIIDCLENAFLIRRLPPWFTNAKKRIVKSPKVYIRDTGMLLNLLKLYSMHDLLGHPQCGAVWEGFVLEQTINQLGKKYDYYFYRTQDGTEADLVLVKAGKPFAVAESKFNNAPALTAGTYIAIDDLQTRYNFIVTPRQEDTPVSIGKGLQITNVRGWINLAVLNK
ncbi:MAG TPA: ATP-binding protein [Chitinophagaceae bacterium]|nr:ATP-binding protein [Chitinophagaceae bacterium]